MEKVTDVDWLSADLRKAALKSWEIRACLTNIEEGDTTANNDEFHDRLWLPVGIMGKDRQRIKDELLDMLQDIFNADAMTATQLRFCKARVEAVFGRK